MARARNIKPGFFENEYLAELSFEARLLFIGLWTLADREGRLEDRPKRIKATLFPYDELDVNKLLQQLASSSDKFIVRYEHEGEKYIQIANFSKHQNPHIKEPVSTIPAPCEHSSSTVLALYKHSSSPADSPLLNPDSGFRIPIYTSSSADEGITNPTNEKSNENLTKVTTEAAQVLICAFNDTYAQPKVRNNDNKIDESLVVKKATGTGKKPVNRSITLSATQSTQFERFWLAYPKRKSKGDAEKAWNTLQPDEQLVDIMITAIEKAKASNDWQREGGKFIQYPATWLNKKGWQDEFQNDYLAKEAGENGRKSKYDLPADFYWTDTK